MGAFVPEEKLCVAYMPIGVHGMHPGRFPLRLTYGQIRDYGLVYAADLWAPRKLAERWFSARGAGDRPRARLIAARAFSRLAAIA
jgi:hypothetical protein